MKWRHALFLSIFLFFMWWGLISYGPVDCGLDLTPHLSAWILSLLVAGAYLFVFSSLATQYPAFFGFFAAFGFGLTPFYTTGGGVSARDAGILFFWTGILQVLLSVHTKDPDADIFVKAFKHLHARPVIFTTVAATAGSVLMKNTGAALTIALFLLAVAQPFHGIKLPFWRMSIGSLIGTVMAFAVLMGSLSTIAVSGPVSRPEFFELLPAFWWSLVLFAQGTFLSSILCYFIGVGLDIHPDTAALQRGRETVWLTTFCLLGWLLTVLFSLHQNGLQPVWTRQLMPAALLFNGWIFGLIVLLTSELNASDRR